MGGRGGTFHVEGRVFTVTEAWTGVVGSSREGNPADCGPSGVRWNGRGQEREAERWKLLSLLACSGLTCSLSLCPPEGMQGKAASRKEPTGDLFNVPSKGLPVSKMILIDTNMWKDVERWYIGKKY